MATALELLALEGPKGFTMEELAHKLGISKKTLYLLFPSRERLLEEVASEVLEDLERTFREVVAGDDRPEEKMVALLLAVQHHISRMPRTHLDQLKSRYPRIWMRVEKFRLAREEYFRRLFEEAKTAAILQPDLDPAALAYLLVNIINSTFQPEYFNRLTRSPVQEIHFFFRIFIRGVFKTDAAARIIKALEAASKSTSISGISS